MKNVKTALAVAITAALTLTGCSTVETNEAKDPWKATEFPSAVGAANSVIPAGTYDFTFSSRMPFEDGTADTVNASGRITVGPDKCELNAQAQAVSSGRTVDYRIVKPADKGVHIYDGAAKQWVTNPSSLPFMPMMSFAGASIVPKADQYGSFCVLNAIALVTEQSAAEGEEDIFVVNPKVLARYIQANADWYIESILTAISYAGDTREAAVPLLQKYFNLDKVDTTIGSEEIFTISRGENGSLTVSGARGAQGSTADRGTFVLTPTTEPVNAVVPAGEVPILWTKLIANGVELAGTMENYLAGIFPEQSPKPDTEKDSNK